MTDTDTTAHIPEEAVPQAAKLAAVKAYTEIDGKCRPVAMTAALAAALPYLSAPYAVNDTQKQSLDIAIARLLDLASNAREKARQFHAKQHVGKYGHRKKQRFYEEKKHFNRLAIGYSKSARAIRALSPAEPAQGEQWQPIETAPKDGTWIVAVRPKCTFGRWDRVVIVCWSDDFKKWIWPDSQFDVYADDINEADDEGRYTYDPFQSDQFTHWMPLPAAPTTEAGE